jgi:hypothetical protein
LGVKAISQRKGVKPKIRGRKLKNGLSIVTKGRLSKKGVKQVAGAKQDLCLFLPFILDFSCWFADLWI